MTPAQAQIANDLISQKKASIRAANAPELSEERRDSVLAFATLAILAERLSLPTIAEDAANLAEMIGLDPHANLDGLEKTYRLLADPVIDQLEIRERQIQAQNTPRSA